MQRTGYIDTKDSLDDPQNNRPHHDNRDIGEYEEENASDHKEIVPRLYRTSQSRKSDTCISETLATISGMSLFEKTYSYFQELSKIPRPSHHEGKVREWLISWAKSHNFVHEEDAVGNLLITAPWVKEGKLALQSHMDMVCVSEETHDWQTEWVTIREKDGIISGDKTTLGADNGIGVAAMMALAELENRPTLELLFTMGEEIGLIGAHNIELPLTAPYALNLDWCHSETIGIGCGGTLLMEWSYQMKNEEWRMENAGIYTLKISGMRGWHSGVDILDSRGNALIELSRILTERDDIVGVGEIHGGDADNAIPRSGKATILFSGKKEVLDTFLLERTKELQTKTNTPHIQITAEKKEYAWDFYEKSILGKIATLGSGVQIWAEDSITPLSSWNLGKMKLTDGMLTWCYFLRTNIVWGIEPMKNKILSVFNIVNSENLINIVNFELSHEWPVWLADANSPFVQWILASIKSYNDKSIPAITMHATMEAGTLAQKFPNTQWVSIGASCHDMHTTGEHIYRADLEEFCGRLERIITTA